jgi:hypothetical protein
MLREDLEHGSRFATGMRYASCAREACEAPLSCAETRAKWLAVVPKLN